MKVRELQEQLSKFDPELDVVCYGEDERLVDQGRGVVLLDVLAASTADAELLRLDDGTPHLRLGTGPRSRRLAILEVTSEF